jgi:2-polyprenyl-6-methoxyphenol hydroxylase-like FAD-dependent oxidoreductase
MYIPNSICEIIFKVTVVGGSLVGITAAHVLLQAGIDFIILEAHSHLTPWIGSLLVIWPATYPIFNRLGIREVMHPTLDKLTDYGTINAGDGSFLRCLSAVGDRWARKYVNLLEFEGEQWRMTFEVEVKVNSEAKKRNYCSIQRSHILQSNSTDFARDRATT